MLQEGNYDVLEFSPPPSGMNQNISPDSLPLTFAYLLENITPKPLGEGQVRFGTKSLTSLEAADSSIIKLFPFVKADGKKQSLLYVQEYVQDTNATGFTLFEGYPYNFSFSSPNNALRYVKDAPIKVTYTYNGIATILDTIAAVTVQDNTVNVTLANNALPPLGFLPEPVINSVSFSSGTLYAYDLSTGILSEPLRSNLSVACIPRCTTYLNTLVICNGVDRVMSWNGTALEDVYDFVKEEATAISRLDNKSFSFMVSASFNIEDYAVGKLVQIKTGGSSSVVTIESADEIDQYVIITTKEVLPEFAANTEVLYQAFLPRFNFLYVAHDRLWALGEGAAGIEYRHPQEALKVYYTSKTNTVTGWFNEKTKTVPSIDLSKKHGEPDNLEAICLVGGLMAFIGRQKTQVYQGQSPLAPNEGGDFVFNSILSTGVIHGDLVLELPNDVFFVTAYGLQSFSTLNVARQFAATSLNAIDPLLREQVASLMTSNSNYWKATSFKYDAGGLAGFKLGVSNVLVSLFSTSLEAWSMFSGDFERARSFLSLGNALYLSLGNKLFQYADGRDGIPPIYGDQNGEALVFFSWTLPVISLNGRRFAGKRYEIQMDYPSSFTVRPQNDMTINVSGDLPKSYQITSPCRFEMRGDALQTVPLTKDNPVKQDSLGFRLDQPYGIFKDRFKFLASRFWLTLSGMTKDGPLTIRKCKLYGVIERR